MSKNEIIDFVAESRRFVPHFHIPLQSGSNEILGHMKRRYKRELYAERVAKIRERMPDCCIGVDVIVGFPGETDTHFQETYQFLNELDVSYLHVFTYSERDNTPAKDMAGVVPVAERKRRNKMLRILSAKKLRACYEKQNGKSATVLFEQEERNGWMYGFTENYVKVKVAYDVSLINASAAVVLGATDEDGLVSCE